MTIWLIAFAIVVLIVLSGFFSGSETALTAASRARMHVLEKGGDHRAGLVARLTQEKDRLIGALLLSNNLVNILASALATALFIDLFGQAGVFYATLLMTVVVVIFAEVLPKSWAIAVPERFALVVAPAVNVVTIVFGPLVRVITALVRRILRLFGIDMENPLSAADTHDELRGTVDVAYRDGAVVKDDRDRVGGVLDLAELEVSDVMIHRTSMASIDLDIGPAAMVEQVLVSPFTRLPVWQGEPDDIVGFVHSKALFRELAANGYDPDAIDMEKVMSEPWFVPETTGVRQQLNSFLRRQEHIALVVDEYGEVEGLVTLEDILEEIVGDINDETDEDLAGVHLQPDGSVIVDGSVPIRDLNRALDWDLPDEEANTIAGLVIHAAQMIPDEKQTFNFYGKRFVVLAREKNRIARLRISTRGLTNGMTASAAPKTRVAA